MCFFDQHTYECGDSRFGKFRQHCTRETRAGKTCGAKSILETIFVERKCAICSQIDEKLLQRSKDVETIERLMADGGKERSELEAAIDSIQFLDFDIRNLRREREEKKLTTLDDLPPYSPPSPRASVSSPQDMQQPQQPLLPGIDLNQVSPAALALLASSLLQTERVVYQRQELFFNSNYGSRSNSPLRGQPSQATNLSQSEATRPRSTSNAFVSRNSSAYISGNNSAYVSGTNSPFISRTSSPIPASVIPDPRLESGLPESRPEPRPDAPPFVTLIRAPTYKAEDPGKGKELDREAGSLSPTSPIRETFNDSRESAEFLETGKERRFNHSSLTTETEREETVTWKCKCGETFVSSRSSGINNISSLHICDDKSRKSRSRSPSPLRFWKKG